MKDNLTSHIAAMIATLDTFRTSIRVWCQDLSDDTRGLSVRANATLKTAQDQLRDLQHSIQQEQAKQQ